MGVMHLGAGVVTGADLLEGCRMTTQLRQNTENFHFEFIDFSDVTELKITADDLMQIVAQDHYAAIFRPDAVVVIVAPRDDQFEIGKKWERRVEDIGWKTHIAHDRAEATAWLRENYPAPPVKS
jgi:hypothetical protein